MFELFRAKNSYVIFFHVAQAQFRLDSGTKSYKQWLSLIDLANYPDKQNNRQTLKHQRHDVVFPRKQTTRAIL